MNIRKSINLLVCLFLCLCMLSLASHASCDEMDVEMDEDGDVIMQDAMDEPEEAGLDLNL